MNWRKNSPPASAATTFPGYAGVEEIATGSFASVYRAVELGTRRPVALKVVRVAYASPRMVEAFNKELGALALLSNHPNVTTLYGTFFTPEGRPALALELCRESLGERVRVAGPMSPVEVVQAGVKIAGALETAHRSGLLHLDVKPQNILVSQFGEPVLADFGVAALQAAAHAGDGGFALTSLHAAPEALEGLPLQPTADVYGLASSMYQLLVGHSPFATYEGEPPASIILRILRDPAPRLPPTAAPIALADLIDRALAKDPGRRPRSALAFADALRDVEGRAGWPQTSYVVWGDVPGEAPEPEELAPQGPGANPWAPPGWDGSAPSYGPAGPAPEEPPEREHVVASRLAALLQRPAVMGTAALAEGVGYVNDDWSPAVTGPDQGGAGPWGPPGATGGESWAPGGRAPADLSEAAEPGRAGPQDQGLGQDQDGAEPAAPLESPDTWSQTLLAWSDNVHQVR